MTEKGVRRKSVDEGVEGGYVTAEESLGNHAATDDPQTVSTEDEGGQTEENVDTNNDESMIGAVCEENPKERTRKYLEENGILRMFQDLAAKIVHDRPENPLEYMITNLEQSNGDS